MDEDALAQDAVKLFCRPCEFIFGATTVESLPETRLPEVAFIGRSNVGKSSLINALTGRKALARTSHTPGRTQQLNFFNLADTLMLVDLPGYGYAKASKADLQQWGMLVRGYLCSRPQLQRVCVLIDGRHGLKPSDLDMMEMLDNHAVSYQLVLTKTDKVKQADRQSALAGIEAQRNRHPALHPLVLMTSSVKKDGIAAVQTELYKVTLSWK